MQSLNIVFTGPQKAEVREEALADPSPGQVTVQTRVSLMSIGTESWCYRGEFDSDTGWASWVTHPFYPGYSNVGVVAKVGDGVTRLAEGDRVFTTSNHRQFFNVDAARADVVKLPDALSDEEGSWTKLATITQTGVRHAEHSLGDAAVTIGLGPIGQLVTQYLRVLGLRQILAIDVAPQRLDAAVAHGATECFRGAAAEAKDFVAERTEGRLADVVYDLTGHYSVLPLALRLVRDFGALVLLGDSPHPSRQCLAPDLLTRQIRIQGSHNEKLPPRHAFWTFPRQAALFHQYVAEGRMAMADLVSHRFRPQEAQRVYQDLQTDRSGVMGAVFDWSGV